MILIVFAISILLAAGWHIFVSQYWIATIGSVISSLLAIMLIASYHMNRNDFLYVAVFSLFVSIIVGLIIKKIKW